MFIQLTSTIKKFVRSRHSLSVVIIVVGIATYGLHIFRMGFYWDDWPWIWLSHIKGPQGMLKIDEYHRPLTGVVLYLGSLLAGENPVLWQSYNLLLRLMGVGALAWTLNKLWPHYRDRSIWVILLFLVYPGFSQQFVAVNTSRHIFPLITFFLSLGFMLKGTQGKKHSWLSAIIALTLSLITMLTTEYYYGLEFIRPVLLWICIRRDEKRFISSVLSAFKAWLPYMIPLLVVFGWRYSVTMRVNYGITIFTEITSTSGNGILQLIWNAVLDLFVAMFGGWGVAFEVSNLAMYGVRIQFYYWAIVTSISIGTLVYFFFLHQEEQDKAWRSEAIILGLAALVISPLPFWVTGLDPKLAFSSDRFLLPSILGSSLLLAGAIDFLFKQAPIKVIFLSLIIGLSAGSHNQNAITYRRDWAYTISFFQQLTARAPHLPPNTSILSNELPSRSTDNSLTAPLNWIYSPDFTEGNLPLQLLYVDLRFGHQNTILEDDKFNLAKYIYYPFQGSLEQVLMVYHSPPACLQVVDSNNHQQLPSFMEDFLSYSKPNLILAESDLVASLPAVLSHNQQPHNWCYYFEKADLARQHQNWEQIAQLGDIAFTLSDSPKQISERVPFIEGYAHVGQWERAEEITLEAFKISPVLCQVWERIEADTLPSTERKVTLDRIRHQLDCDFH